jgi:colanic acid/amylovoran biosynthesis glycosyltransferase
MRAAIITETYPFGPGEAFLDAELRAMVSTFDEVVIVPIFPRRGELSFRVPNTRVNVTMPWSASTLWRALRASVRQPKRVLRVVRRVLGARCAPITKLRYLRYLPKAIAVAEALRADHVQHVHGYWLSQPAFIASTIAEFNEIPWSASAHKVDINHNDFFPAYFGRRERPPAFLRAISQRGRDDIVLAAGTVAANLTTVVHIGVDLPSVVLQPPPRDELVVLCVAFLVEGKGHDDLLEAIAVLRRENVRVRCVLAGEGPLRPTLERRIRRLGLDDAVATRGLVAHDELLAEMRAGHYDVMVLASRELFPGVPAEGIPVSLMEAMASGIPCVGTDGGGIPDLLDGCGIVVPQNRPTAIADALRTLAHDRELRSRLQRSGRARVERSFNARVNGAVLAALIHGESRYRAITDSTTPANASANARVEQGGSTAIPSPPR